MGRETNQLKQKEKSELNDHWRQKRNSADSIGRLISEKNFAVLKSPKK